jgi:hypothetical protein
LSFLNPSTSARDIERVWWSLDQALNSLLQTDKEMSGSTLRVLQ